MKNCLKISLFIILSIFSQAKIISGESNTKSQKTLSKKETIKSAVRYIKDKTIYAGSKGINSFKFIVDKADRIFSKKVAIATILLLTPAIIAYEKYINPDHIKNLTQKGTEIVAEKTTDIFISGAEGVTIGVIKGLEEHKKTVAGYAAGTAGLTFFTWAGILVSSPFFKSVGEVLGKLVASRLGGIINPTNPR